MKFLSGLTGPLSGSIGGLTASHNRYGQYFRERSTPTNPNTPLQQTVRNIWQFLTNEWKNVLVAAERDAWNLYAANVVWKDKQGSDINLTGYNMFMRSNCVALRGSLPQIASGPTNFTLAPGDATFAITASEATQLVSVAFNDTAPWVDLDDAAMQVLMSKPVNDSINFIPPTYRLLGFILGDAITPETSPVTIAPPFVITATQQIQCEGRIILPDGRLSGGFRAVVEVAA